MSSAKRPRTEFAKDFLLCTRFEGAADATVAVNSPPVATAHHLIDYSAVGGEKGLGTDHLITLCVTAIHCKPPWIREVCKQSPRAIPNLFASWRLGSSFPPPPPHQPIIRTTSIAPRVEYSKSPGRWKPHFSTHCLWLRKSPQLSNAKDDRAEGVDFTPKEYLFLVFHSASSADGVVQFAQVIFQSI